MYLTYQDYVEMGGTLDETAFNDIEFEAEGVINWHTFNRLKNEEYELLDEAVKKCMYRLIQLVYQHNQALSLGADINNTNSASITSQSNDGVSISYNAMSASEVFKNSEEQVNRYVKILLTGVTNSIGKIVLYRGLYPDE